MIAIEAFTVEIEVKSSEIKRQVDSLNITDMGSYEFAANVLKGVKGLINEVKCLFAPHKKKASEAHKGLVKDESERLTPLQEAEDIIKGKMTAYLKAEEEKRKVLQARLEAEAKKHQEEIRLQEAVALEAAGDTEGAIAILDAPGYTPAPLFVSNIPKVSGVSEREVWDFEVVDAKLVPDQYKTVNMTAIRGVVRSLKGATDIPGVKVFVEKQMAVRA
ncbi:MAG: hypothetical protein HQL05_03770 [Nitrospirae bacterium]|uniref:hypothetical protein n=1 Tax=Candidatus Magnetobacterium casense TaxID=1455061 RepID=UPI0005905AC7|nr:hypothetical protein [Candidatus Magnetobacterium casensis]MBF0336927.1 hypothetical protein [Nitrospirota bacterium]